MDYEKLVFILIGIFMALTTIDSMLSRIRIHDIEKRFNANTQEPTKTPPKAKIKPTEQTDEQRQYNTLMSNIDNYNGTGAKQEKVR